MNKLKMTISMYLSVAESNVLECVLQTALRDSRKEYTDLINNKLDATAFEEKEFGDTILSILQKVYSDRLK